MTGLACVTTCMGRLAHLRHTLPRMAAQPGVSCVVVDYSCPDGTAQWVEREFPQVKVVRVVGETRFNASRARNAGAAVAEAQWLAFLDADILLDESFASVVVPALRRGYFYRSDAVTRQSWGSVICDRDDFIAAGRYDEAFEGWGGEDDDLFARLVARGTRAATFPGALLGEIEHPDELRTLFHEVKDWRVQLRINTLYQRIKLDLVRLPGVELSPQALHAIFGEVRRSVLAAAPDASAPVTLQLDLAALHLGRHPLDTQTFEIGRKLLYTMRITDAG
jgi:glycosyltransferase involved in cell wall biosynthesis